MKIMCSCLLALLICWMTSCDDNENLSLKTFDLKTLEIGDYAFEFPTQFDLKENEGTDSYVGTIEGLGIKLDFDFGGYSDNFNHISLTDYEVLNETFENVERKIVVANNPEENFTGIYLRDLDNFSSGLNNYISLSMYTTNSISKEEQDLVLQIFETVRLID